MEGVPVGPGPRARAQGPRDHEGEIGAQGPRGDQKGPEEPGEDPGKPARAWVSFHRSAKALVGQGQ